MKQLSCTEYKSRALHIFTVLHAVFYARTRQMENIEKVTSHGSFINWKLDITTTNINYNYCIQTPPGLIKETEQHHLSEGALTNWNWYVQQHSDLLKHQHTLILNGTRSELDQYMVNYYNTPLISKCCKCGLIFKVAWRKIWLNMHWSEFYDRSGHRTCLLLCKADTCWPSAVFILKNL